MRKALLAIGEAGLMRGGVGREGGMLLDWQLFLYEVSQSLPCDVKWVEAKIIVLLLLLGWGAKTKGCLPISWGRHRDSFCKKKETLVGFATYWNLIGLKFNSKCAYLRWKGSVVLESWANQKLPVVNWKRGAGHWGWGWDVWNCCCLRKETETLLRPPRRVTVLWVRPRWWARRDWV